MAALSWQVSTILTQSQGSARTRKHTILVVDDEPDICNAIKRLLESRLKNVEVVTAPDGFKGLEALRTHAVDLILTDFKMPGMNGYEFITEARKAWPRTPRILITAFDRELAGQSDMQHTFNQIFTKPLDPQPLLKSCQRMLSEAPV